MSASTPPPLAWHLGWRVLGPAGQAAALLLLGLMAASLLLYAPAWRSDPDFSHGWFTPLLFVWLLVAARQIGPPRWLQPFAGLRALQALTLGLAVVLLAMGALYAVAIGRDHALVLNFSGTALTLTLLVALSVMAQTRVRLVPLNWPSLVGIGLWLLSMPLPPGTYSRLTVTLQLWVTERVMDSLHLLGIPAEQFGNIIHIGQVTVGVEAACSGVRSLIACVYAGFLLSALMLRSPWSRVTMVLAAPLIAIGMNAVRSLGLTLLAYRGVDIRGAWHDNTGFAILIVTTLILAGLGVLLEGERRPQLPPDPTAPAPGARPPGGVIWLTGCAASAVIVVMLAWLTLSSPARERAIPELHALLPAELDGWNVETSRTLYRFTDILQTELLAQRSYWRIADGEVQSITIYVAYWPAGAAPVSLVASHTPDACWPGSGWVPDFTQSRREALNLADDTLLPMAEGRLFYKENRPQHVWFWHFYDGQVVGDINPRSPFSLIGSVIRHGVRSSGDQIFLRVSSNQTWPDIAGEPVLGKVFQRLQETLL